jgi:5-formyltetrahydrofolate cyclo-ligase
MSDSIDALKTALRREAIARRDALTPASRATAAEAIAARPFPVVLPPTTVVAGFMPIRSEIDPRPLLRRLEAAGARLALPAVIGRGQALAMRAYETGASLVAGVWGIREPPADAPDLLPDVVIVPLLAFDRRGHRLGYGVGYYDRTIPALRASKPVVAVGIAFAEQEIAEVPITAHDARLDVVLTERETVVISPEGV